MDRCNLSGSLLMRAAPLTRDPLHPLLPKQAGSASVVLEEKNAASMKPEASEIERRLVALATQAATVAVQGKIDAVLSLNAKTLKLLVQKGLISEEELETFVSEYELVAAAISKLSPEVGKDTLDLAIKLRHSLSKSSDRIS